MFIIIIIIIIIITPTNAHVSSTELILKLLRHVSVFLHYPRLKNIYISYRKHRLLFVLGATAPQWARAPSFTRFLDHTQRRTTVSRTPLDE
jgi:hypothetical protein